MRPAAVAGLFYPEARAALERDVQDMLALATLAPSPEPTEPLRPHAPAKAYLLPHAGYQYSGPTAALGYAELALARGRVGRVVLLGPTHRVPVDGLALPGARTFATPLGEVRVLQPDPALVAALPQVVVRPDVHAMEHSLEVQLPFLQVALGDVAVLPLAVGRAAADDVAAVLDALWGGPETVVVVSSDLSHYLTYEQAAAVDAVTVDQVLALDGPLGHEQACGATPLNGLLLAARRHGLRPRLLGACSSGDTAGDRRRVVGYAAVAFDEPVE